VVPQQQPAAKRARGNLDASVSPGRFLPCHLVMLRSLYAADNVASTGESATGETPANASIDQEVNKEVWHLIDVFLSNRGDLATSKDKAFKSRAVYKSAEHIGLLLNEGVGGVGIVGMAAANSNGIGIQCGQPSSVPSTPLLRTDKLLSPTRSIGVGTPVDMSTSRKDQLHDHYLQQSQNVNSWMLVTKLLGRQHAVTQKDTQLVAEPYQPLVTALNSKLKELRIIYKGLVGLMADRSSVDGEETATSAMLRDGDQSLSSGKRASDGLAQISLEGEDLEAKLECKIRLWSLLLSSVNALLVATD